jgi:hypothetical protein
MDIPAQSAQLKKYVKLFWWRGKKLTKRRKREMLFISENFNIFSPSVELVCKFTLRQFIGTVCFSLSFCPNTGSYFILSGSNSTFSVWVLVDTLCGFRGIMDSFTVRLRLKCDSTRAETRFRVSAKRTSKFKSTGASVQSTTGSRGVRIIGSNAGYTMFRGSVKGTGLPLHSPLSPSLPLPCVTVCHHISAGLYLGSTLHFRAYELTPGTLSRTIQFYFLLQRRVW